MHFAPGTDYSKLDVACPDCGAALRYGGGKKEMVCGDCGYKQSLSIDSGEINPHALVAGVKLDRYPKWDHSSFSAWQCGACKVRYFTATPGQPAACPSCGAESQAADPEPPACILPAGILPALISEKVAHKRLYRHIGRKPLLIDAVRALRKSPGLRLVYAPIWTLDAWVRATWRAEVGFEYETEANGKKEKKTLFEYLKGYLETFCDRMPVNGSKLVPELKEVWDYPWDQALPMQAVYLAQGFVEGAATGSDGVLKEGEKLVDKQLEIAAGNKVPGASYKDLVISADKRLLALRIFLVPVWVTSYVWAGKTYRMVVNGATGKVFGQKILDPKRVVVAVAAGVGLAVLAAAVAVWVKG